jgi:hypothetical protein
MHLLYDGNVTAGDILMCISFLVAVFGAYNRISERLTKIETRLSAIGDWFTNCQKGDCPMVREFRDKNLIETLRHLGLVQGGTEGGD